MISLYLSEKYPEYYHVAYSKNVEPEEDDEHVVKYLKHFLENRETIYYICEMDLSGAILNKKWFEVSDLGNFDKQGVIKKMIGFGFNAEQKSRFEIYLKEVAKFGIMGELYNSRQDFEKAQNFSIKNDFSLVFTYEYSN